MTFNNPSLSPVDIIAIYHPPNPTLNNSFFDHIDSILDSLATSNTNQVIGGDFNICGLRDTPISNPLFNIMRSYSFMPHISKITRYNAYGSSTTIDHLWSNFGHNFDSGVFNEIKISDHYVTYAFLPFIIEKTKIITRFRNHSEECITKLIDCLTNFRTFFPLLSANLDFDAKFDLFYDETMRLYKKCCEIKTKEISLNNVKKPWISRDIMQKIRLKHLLFKRFKNNEIPYEQFNIYQKDLQKLIKRAKQEYFELKYRSFRGNPKKTWKLTNNILGKSKKKSNSISLKHEGHTIDDETEVANIFNNYFVNIGHNLIENIDNQNLSPMEFMGERISNSFVFFFNKH